MPRLPMSTPRAQLNIRQKPGDHEQLNELANRLNTSITEAIRLAVRDKLRVLRQKESRGRKSGSVAA